MAFRFPGPVYPIVDPAAMPGRTPAAWAEAIIDGGVCVLQLRVKGVSTGAFVEIARAVKVVTDRRGARLIVNDRADVAHLVDAAGVHLGQDDLPPDVARRMLGAHKLIGLSTHTLAQVEDALRAGVADYLAFGPIFPTRSKEHPDPAQGIEGLRHVRRRCPLPMVAIGGITAATLTEVLHTGANAVAIIGAIAHADDPGAATQALVQQANGAISRRARPRSSPRLQRGSRNA